VQANESSTRLSFTRLILPAAHRVRNGQMPPVECAEVCDGRLKQRLQLLKSLGAEMTEDRSLKAINMLIQAAQNLMSLFSNSDFHNPAILAIAHARHQAAAAQTIQETRDVGVAGNMRSPISPHDSFMGWLPSRMLSRTVLSVVMDTTAARRAEAATWAWVDERVVERHQGGPPVLTAVLPLSMYAFFPRLCQGPASAEAGSRSVPGRTAPPEVAAALRAVALGRTLITFIVNVSPR
jgi:hypothetical protein